MERKPIDIIIPVYNAYEELRKCIDSLKKYTNLEYDRVVIINDCSPDERILPYLESVKSSHIQIINNVQNKGFSGNVNIGMQTNLDHDVILLNSDTIVTKNWIDKIYNCAYSSVEIGTVTPLSNNATLCSVPVMCADNEIPEHFTIDEYADLIERVSMRKYPEISVAVGFCMFIKREVIDQIGYFDAETFEKGYGEENDFCNRAEQAGYVQVMCDDTFIYHSGSVSFVSEEKQELMKAHEKILDERYPVQMWNNHMYCVNNPDQDVRDNINFYAKLKNGKKNILYLIHSDFREEATDNVGGTQFYLRDLVGQMKKHYNVYVLARVADRLELSIYANDELIVKRFPIEKKPSFPQFRKTSHYAIYEDILRKYAIDLVHVQHTFGLTFDMFYAAEELHIPIYMTLHDYYYICPNITLYNTKHGHCENIQDQGMCRDCLYERSGIVQSIDYLDKWRTSCLEVLRKCERLITPSESTKEIFSKFYPELENRMKVIYHGSGFEKIEDSVIDNPEKIIVSDQVHVCWDHIFDFVEEPGQVIGWAFVDNADMGETVTYLEVTNEHQRVNYIKASTILRPDVAEAYGNSGYEKCGFRVRVPQRVMYNSEKLKLRLVIKQGNEFYSNGEIREYMTQKKDIKENKFNIAFVGGMVAEKGSEVALELIQSLPSEVNWFTFGTIADPEMATYEQDNFYKMGSYEKSELPELLKEFHINLVCILSVCPETFCYTLSETLECKIPVLVNDIGALGERIRKNHCGWLVDTTKGVRSITEKVMEIQQDKKLYNDMLTYVKQYDSRTVEEMGDDYYEFYKENNIQ